VLLLTALATFSVNAYGYTYEVVYCGSNVGSAGTTEPPARICFVAPSSMLPNYGSLFVIDASGSTTRYELEQNGAAMEPTSVDGAIYDADYAVIDGQADSTLTVRYVYTAGRYIGDGGYEPERLV
jgi:hypothetical protein